MTSVHSELSQYIENIEKYRKLLDRRSIEFRKVPNILRLLLPNLGSTTGVTLVDRTCSPPLLPMRSNSGLSQPLQCMNVACYMRGL